GWPADVTGSVGEPVDQCRRVGAIGLAWWPGWWQVGGQGVGEVLSQGGALQWLGGWCVVGLGLSCCGGLWGGFEGALGTAARIGDSSSHAASATVVFMVASNSIGVNRPSAACLRRR